jgi:hypothetical protein
MRDAVSAFCRGGFRVRCRSIQRRCSVW